MAQVLIIKAETAKDGLQYIGDVVGVYLDSHQFSSTELAIFSVLTINGSREDVKARLKQIRPQLEDAFLWESDGEYHWDGPEDELDNVLDTIRVYKIEGSNKWYRVDNKFKFPVNIGTLTPEEKQLLETVNINHPSVDSFIRKLVKDITALSGNDVEIKELRNTEPN